MARYKPYSYEQGKFIPIHFEKQILPCTFEYSLNHLIDNELVGRDTLHFLVPKTSSLTKSCVIVYARQVNDSTAAAPTL
ncbi:MAG: hypothetical protein HY739_05315 [Desulfobacterales bacterium]|nr:hypothetical protein [Desulfobacterales bacterium]